MKRLFDNPAVRASAVAWWRKLDDDRGARARLRRVQDLCVLLREPTSPGERMARRSVFALKDALNEAVAEQGKKVCLKRLAPVAALLAHVRSDVPDEQSIALLFAGGSDGRTPLTERRFQRLLHCQDYQALHDELRRALQQLGRHAPVGALACDIYHWNDRVRGEWARIYYKTILTAEYDPAESVERFGQAARAWWQTLEDHPGERAALARCHKLEDALLLKGYHRLWQYAARFIEDEQKEMRRPRLALVAIALAHVREDLHSFDKEGKYRPITLAELAASSKKHVRALREGREVNPHSEARVSDLRFRRLLQADTHSDLYRPLLRVIHQVGREAVDVGQLADDLFYWGEQRRRRWADQYYHIALRPLADAEEDEAAD